MKILKLLQELYIELKVFNENVEYFSLLEGEKRRNEENPVRRLTNEEKYAFKNWLRERLEAKKITIDSRKSLAAYKYFEGPNRICPSKYACKAIAEALGCDSFNDLLNAWRQSKGGAE